MVFRDSDLVAELEKNMRTRRRTSRCRATDIRNDLNEGMAQGHLLYQNQCGVSAEKMKTVNDASDKAAKKNYGKKGQK